jgi:hypothetical protein
MKKLLISTAALAAMSTGAFAQSATQNIALSATVPGFCQIDGSSTGNARTGTITPSATGTVGNDPVAIGGGSPAVCNVKSKITLTTQNGGVKAQTVTAAPSAPFSNVIAYTATAAFDGATATLTTNGTAGQNVSAFNPTGGASSGTLAVTVTTIATATGTYLVADNNYQDVLKVQLDPAP